MDLVNIQNISTFPPVLNVTCNQSFDSKGVSSHCSHEYWRLNVLVLRKNNIEIK